MLKSLLAWLDGKKTYMVSAFVAAVVVLKLFGVLTNEQFEALLALLGSFGLYAVRDAVRKLQK